MKKVDERPVVYLNPKSFDEQLADALAFFGALESETQPSSDNPYADKDGLIEFICGTELLQDPVISAKLVELKSLLISITTVVTSYINRYAEKNGAQYKTDPQLWSLALSKIPLMGASKSDAQTYDKKTKGIEIAGDFINLVLDIAAAEGSALNSFKSFLEKQGGALRAGLDESSSAYSTITIGVSVEVMMVGEQIVYVPKIKQYRVNFTRENSEWSSSCASYKEVVMHFDYQYNANVFDYEALDKEDVRKKFDKFISDSQQAQIENATTFFSDDFEAKI